MAITPITHQAGAGVGATGNGVAVATYNAKVIELNAAIAAAEESADIATLQALHDALVASNATDAELATSAATLQAATDAVAADTLVARNALVAAQAVVDAGQDATLAGLGVLSGKNTIDAAALFDDGIITETKLAAAVQTKLNQSGGTPAADSITEAMLVAAVRSKLNTSSGTATDMVNVWLHDYADLQAAFTDMANNGHSVLGVKGTITSHGTEFGAPKPTTDITIVGIDPLSSILDGGDNPSLMQVDGTTVEFRNITVQNYSRDAIYMAGTAATSIRAFNCHFRDIGMSSDGVAYNDRWGAISTSGQGGAGPIEEVTIMDCIFKDCFIGVNIRADVINNVTCIGNRISSDGGMSGINIGDDPQTFVGAQGHWVFTNNIITDITNTLGLTETHAFQILGSERIIMTNNIFVNIDGGSGTEGVYFKAQNAIFGYNVMIDAGGHNYGALTIKKYTSQEAGQSIVYGVGEPNLIIGNIIGFTDDYYTAHPSFETTCMQSNSSGNNIFMMNDLFGFTVEGINLLSSSESIIKMNNFHSPRDNGNTSYCIALRGQPPNPQTTPPQYGAIGTEVTENKFIDIDHTGTSYCVWARATNNAGGTALMENIKICNNTMRNFDIGVRLQVDAAAENGRRIRVTDNIMSDGSTGMQLSGVFDNIKRYNDYHNVTTKHSGSTPTAEVTTAGEWITTGA